jgi:DNA-binding transcriptional ArsR family regulator
MEQTDAVKRLSALAHEGRLSVVRLLVKAGPKGLAAGEIARGLAMLPNTLSANLNVLSHAGLVQSRREGRSIVYSADFARMGELLAFLLEDCCQGRPEVCVPVLATAGACCPAPAEPM